MWWWQRRVSIAEVRRWPDSFVWWLSSALLGGHAHVVMLAAAGLRRIAAGWHTGLSPLATFAVTLVSPGHTLSRVTPYRTLGAACLRRTSDSRDGRGRLRPGSRSGHGATPAPRVQNSVACLAASRHSSGATGLDSAGSIGGWRDVGWWSVAGGARRRRRQVVGEGRSRGLGGPSAVHCATHPARGLADGPLVRGEITGA